MINLEYSFDTLIQYFNIWYHCKISQVRRRSDYHEFAFRSRFIYIYLLVMIIFIRNLGIELLVNCGLVKSITVRNFFQSINLV